MTDELWLEAAARVQAEDDADLRAEAAEVFLAEAARTRLEDHTGPARIHLRCGQVVDGRLERDDELAGHLTLRGVDGARQRVPITAIVRLSGSHPALRDEGGRARTLTSLLRERWRTGEVVGVLDRSGGRSRGTIDFVGADHVVLLVDAAAVTIPFHAVDAWRC